MRMFTMTTENAQAIFSAGVVIIVTALASCKSGVPREELIAKTDTNGGTLKKALDELVRCDFVRQFNAWHKKNRDAFFQLTFPACLPQPLRRRILPP